MVSDRSVVHYHCCVTIVTLSRWVFRQLYDKGLVYRGYKVMPFSTGCHTPLSNFEAGQNYKDVNDPSG